MGFTAKEISTNKLYYSKGANKIADLIGCHYSTITKHFQITTLDKVIKGYIVSKTTELSNKDRGSSTKSIFNARNNY